MSGYCRVVFLARKGSLPIFVENYTPMTRSTFLLLLFLLATGGSSTAQLATTDALYKTILSKDSLLFSVGYNTCNISQLEQLLAKNFEFHHDKDGISDKKGFLQAFRNGLCKDPEHYQARRVLVDGSTEIYPMYRNGILYAAIQNGDHLFHEKETGQEERFGSAARFAHLWVLEKGDWKLSRAWSFDHQEKQGSVKGKSIFDDDAAIEGWLKENKIPTLGLGIIEEGKLKQVKVFGAIREGEAAPYNTQFNVASLTKPITAMVALRLISLGKWSLDEPIAAYYTDPDVAKDPRSRKLTTRLILSHQTGFPNWRWMRDDKKLQFEFEPGTGYQYSGEGFEYLRKALERKFRKPLQELARELVFGPLKMDDTNYIWDSNTEESRFAIGYDADGKPYETIRNKTANAADDLHTTVADYGRFLVNILEGGNLDKAVYQEMIGRQVQTKEHKYFGLGFEIYDLGNGEHALAHGGSDFGCQTIAFILPKTGQGIVIFTNTDQGYKVFEKLLVHYLGESGRKIIDIERE